MDFYLIKMAENGSEWLGVDLYLIKMGRSGFLFNKNGSEWIFII